MFVQAPFLALSYTGIDILYFKDYIHVPLVFPNKILILQAQYTFCPK